LSPDGRSLGVQWRQREGWSLALYDTGTSRARLRYSEPGGADPEVVAFQFGAQPGLTVVNATTLGELGGIYAQVWRLDRDEKPLRVPRWLQPAQISATRPWIAIPDARADFVAVWDVATSRSVARLGPHAGVDAALAFDAAGTRLATGGGDGSIKLWDAAGGAELATLQAHSTRVVAVAFSPDGRLLASAGEDGEVRLLRIEPD
jgi:WD40 repeat protein